ncbi:MAG: hypothetical protein K2L82_08055 [Lachnospiraceae bacterium]|nr:hypothetical protein [Lachnospiraceae bacterium]
MRIGNTDDINKSAKSDNLIKLLQPENQETLTRAQQLKNWWYYRKWYVIAGVLLFGICCSLIGNALGLFTKAPDLQIAYVGKAALPQDTIEALQHTFITLAGDYNNDGEIIVQINQYISDSENVNPELSYYQYASEVTLIGDISKNESYFFLMDDPQDFQKEYQLLASPDGSCPNEADYSVEDKIILWSDCPLLYGPDLGQYSEAVADSVITGSNQSMLSNLYLGRRCFYTDKTSDNLEECGALWDLLYGSCKNIKGGRFRK